MMKAPVPVLIGTSGWSYPSGEGSWNGIFYPPRGVRRFRAGQELAFYAEHFDTVEVNSTFYRQPDERLTRRWVEQTRSGFEFSIKLYQGFTHPEMHGRGSGTLPKGASPIPQPARGDFDAFRAGIEPMAAAGRLGMVLVQFPASFHRTPEATAYLASLLGRLEDYPLAVELRHRTWSDTEAQTESLLAEVGATWVQIDEPKFRFSIRQDQRKAGRSAYYLRLHGRNAANWWKHDSPDDRYNYLYSPAQLSGFADAVKDAGARVEKAYVYLNNHFAAKSVVNATVLKHQLGQPVKGEYTEEIVRQYPELEPIVAKPPQDLLS